MMSYLVVAGLGALAGYALGYMEQRQHIRGLQKDLAGTLGVLRQSIRNFDDLYEQCQELRALMKGKARGNTEGPAPTVTIKVGDVGEQEAKRMAGVVRQALLNAPRENA